MMTMMARVVRRFFRFGSGRRVVLARMVLVMRRLFRLGRGRCVVRAMMIMMVLVVRRVLRLGRRRRMVRAMIMMLKGGVVHRRSRNGGSSGEQKRERGEPGRKLHNEKIRSGIRNECVRPVGGQVRDVEWGKRGLCSRVKEKEKLVSLKNVKRERKKEPYRQPSGLR